ncbi:MAG: D-alanyl-D-alanine carboxypeptidase/D-alanyl-D-alanine-endopeptidase [Planctomycetota bacterium]
MVLKHAVKQWTRRLGVGTVISSAALVGIAGPAQADLENQTKQILGGADLGDTLVSVLVVDLDANDTLVALKPDRPMIPASNLKLLTTAAALDRLGPDFKFTTDLTLLAPLSPPPGTNSLNAPAPPDLRLTGSGDPALGDDALLAELELEPDAVLDKFVEAVVATGHRRFGVLYLDDDAFDEQHIHPTWPSDQLDKHYCAPVAGLNFHGNVLDVLYVPAALRGEAPTVQVYPWWPQLETVNRAVTGPRDAFWISRTDETNRFTFGGQVRNTRSTPLRTTLHDPPMFLGELLKHRLAQAGVTVERVARVDPNLLPRDGEALYRVQTTLPGVLDRTNQDSANLFAEALFKRMGRELTGAPGSFESGGAAVRMYLQERMGHRVAVALVQPADGSGLSRENRITARVLVETLRDMHDRSDIADVYRGSLAVAGEIGTLRRRGEGLEGVRVYGKSGFIRGVSGLSGYLVVPDPTVADGTRTLAFSMLFNEFKPPRSNATMKTAQDRLLQAWAEHMLAAVE